MLSLSAPGSVRRNRELRRYLLAGGGVAAIALAAYQIHKSDAIGRSKRYLTRLRTALQQYTDALATGGEICSNILRDLQQFLQSDANQVPPSLQQVSKILRSTDFTETTTATVAAIYQGVTGNFLFSFLFTTRRQTHIGPATHTHTHYHHPQAHLRNKSNNNQAH